MHVLEIWRYPVKSLKGEPLQSATIEQDGIVGDRRVVVVSRRRGRVVTARTHPRLLGLQGATNGDGISASINGAPWDSPEAARMVQDAAGEPVDLVSIPGPERFDVLPLLVTTDGAVSALGVDRRRLRPNIVIGGAKGLIEREWPKKRIRIGEVEIYAAQLRSRCIMTTFDPDTLRQDRSVLFRIVDEFDGTMGLDCSIITPGAIRLGDPVSILD